MGPCCMTANTLSPVLALVVVFERVQVLVYTLCGAFAGLAGLMQFSRLTVGDPTVDVGLELNVIAVVLDRLRHRRTT